MAMIAQILFIIISASAIFLFTKQLLRIRRNIFIGKNNLPNDQKVKRWKNVFLLALGQKKMFKKPIVAFLHLIVYLGFIIINIELLEIMIDGILGTHRIFETYFEKWGFPFLYNVIITIFELLAALVIMACVFFLTRRNLLKLKRFISKDLEGWPRTDANYILIAEIILMSLFLLMNAADTKTHFIISSYLQPFLSGLSNNTLLFIEQSAWWLHILGIYVFMNYLPYSKHLHIILAFLVLAIAITTKPVYPELHDGALTFAFKPLLYGLLTAYLLSYFIGGVWYLIRRKYWSKNQELHHKSRRRLIGGYLFALALIVFGNTI